MNAPAAPVIQSKLPEVGTTIFTVMSPLAAGHGAVNPGRCFPYSQCYPTVPKLGTPNETQGRSPYLPLPPMPPTLT